MGISGFIVIENRCRNADGTLVEVGDLLLTDPRPQTQPLRVVEWDEGEPKGYRLVRGKTFFFSAGTLSNAHLVQPVLPAGTSCASMHRVVIAFSAVLSARTSTPLMRHAANLLVDAVGEGGRADTLYAMSRMDTGGLDP